MRGKLVEHEDALDEALLSNAFAWMRKAADDRLDGMVALLQKVGASVRLPGGRGCSAYGGQDVNVGHVLPTLLNSAPCTPALPHMPSQHDMRPAHLQHPHVQVLQLYAAHALSRSGGGGGGGGGGGDGGSSVAEDVVQRLLAADEESWDTLLGEAASSQVGGDVVPGFQLGCTLCGKPDRSLFCSC